MIYSTVAVLLLATIANGKRPSSSVALLKWNQFVKLSGLGPFKRHKNFHVRPDQAIVNNLDAVWAGWKRKQKVFWLKV